MINLHLTIRNPFSDRFQNIKCWAGGTWLKHKSWEVQIMKTADIVCIGINITHRQDHAGIQFSLGLIGYNIDINLYDNRHWDHESKQWTNYSEENVWH